MTTEQSKHTEQKNQSDPETSKQDGIILDIRNLKKYYPVYKGFLKKVVGYVKAVDDVSLIVRKGETLGLVGESGCGKTTLGKTIVRLHQPTAGELRYRFKNGEMRDILKLNREESFQIRKKIQIVFQDPYSSLNPIKTIYESFDEPLRKHNMGNIAERKAIISRLLESVNLRPEYMYRYPNEFSGGQRQRICIARALCINPDVIVCDEPVSALDVSIQAQVLNLMKDLQQEFKLTYIFIAHDLSVVEYMSDRIAVMYLGQVVELAESSALYLTPKHPYTEALLSAVPTPDLNKKKDRIVLKGDVPSPVNPPSGCRFHTRCHLCQDICRTEMPTLRKVKGTDDHFVSCHLVETEDAT
ncbi:ABC transporter ATP-binding protein [Paenibacillus eucommiae]|uniref:Oligopeptide/dipeptide ABC transporter ATP-binding protein n=1 Tax=Paenibacillus eucommiae TaxID=1355755 RepID=A0ABS4IW43_9BACL|nr:dipeptide ABC transporter ATP-binding protein [Paenibacillus eucommiae]MBP1991061.1 oligopeptide/dipeptide ABC transporter ATP-binding protein [Paenibacillus eucommiae]